MKKSEVIRSHNDQVSKQGLRRHWWQYVALSPMLVAGALVNIWVYSTVLVPVLRVSAHAVTSTARTLIGANKAQETSVGSSSANNGGNQPGGNTQQSQTSTTQEPRPDAAKAHPLVIGSAQELGSIGAPANVKNRDAGASVRIGSKVLWAFGDTLFSPKSADGSNARSNTAALADIATPRATSEPTDATGAPYQFIPFTGDELSYNTAKNSGQDRYAIWPNSMASINDSLAAVFFIKVKVKPGTLAYDFVGSGVAYANSNSTTASRQGDLVFYEHEGKYTYGRASVRSGPYIYTYACGGGPPDACTVARVATQNVTQLSGYTYWDGANWGSDSRKAVPVVPGPHAMFSVSWNEYLQRYIAVYMPAFSRNVMIRTAPSPEGPWSEPVKAFTAQAPPSGQYTYAALEHAELAKDGGKKLFISYFLPSGGYRGALQLVELNLN